MKIQYLEIVSLDVDSTCQAYEAALGASFSEPDMLLGGARTIRMPDGSTLGVRSPLRDTETPVVRPYWLVDNIDDAVVSIEAQGAEVAMYPLEIPTKGKFAIYILHGVEQGFWQT